MTHSTDTTKESARHTDTLGKIYETETTIKTVYMAEAEESSDAPYKGLDPYSESEADSSIFFGRESNTQAVINSLLVWRLTIVYGKSGVGKSSLLRAGVTHALNEEARQKSADFEGVSKLAVVVFPSLDKRFSWKKDPLTNLMKHIEETISQRGWGIQPPQSGLPFVETLRSWTEALGGEDGDGDLYIILDQFEEHFLYPLQASGQEAFAVEFLRAVNSPDLNVNFIISIRDDSYFKLDCFKGRISDLFKHAVCIEHLDEESARKAIEEPIRIYNERLVLSDRSVEIKSTLIEAVLQGVRQFAPTGNGRAGIEGLESRQIEAPYLQLVMTRLWEEMAPTSRCLNLELLMGLADREVEGDEKKIQSAVNKIFRDHLKGALERLSAPQKDIAASIFQYLVTPSGTKYAYSILDLHTNLHDNYVGDRIGEMECTEAELTALLEKLASGKQRVVCPVASLPNQPTAYEIFHDVLAQPILDWRKRHLAWKQRERDRKEKEQQMERERMDRTRAIKKELTAQSLQQKLLQQHEVAALLARQAYHFNQQDKLQVLDRVDDALRKVLSASHFSNILKAYTSAFSSIAFSPDGTKLAAASLEGKIWLWNWNRSQHGSKPKTLDDQHENSACEKEVYSLAFSPDGHWLAFANLGNTTIRLWDLHHEDAVCTVIGNHDQGVRCIAFSPDGNLLASGSEDKTVKLWHWHQQDQDPIVLKGHSLKGEMGSVCSLAFSPDTSPDGSQLAVGCFDRSIWLWDVQEPAQTPEKEPTVRYGHEEQVNALAFSPDGQTLASASDDHTIRLWDMGQYRALPKVLTAHTEKIRTLAFSLDGKMLASAGDDQTIRLWDTHEFEKAPQVTPGHTFDIFSVAFSPDGQFLASASGDNTVRIWDLQPPIVKPRILKGHQAKVHSIAISSQDGSDQLLASGSEDGTVRLWKLSQLDAEPKITELEIFKRCGKIFGVALFVSADRQTQLLAAGSADNNIRLWDLKQPSDVSLRELKGHRDGVSSVVFSPDGKWLASGSWKIDGTVKLWNLNQLDPKPIPFTGKGHIDSITSVRSSITSITFSPDGKTVVSAGDDRKICLWNVEQPDADPIVLRNHNGRISSITFSPDGKLLASASDDWEVQVWNLENLDPKDPVHVRLKGHSAWVSSVAFSPDGKTLASGSFDRSIRLWRINQIDWNSRKINVLPIVLENHNQSITSVAFTPDSKYLASGSYDNTVRLWLVSTDRLAEMVCQKVWRNLTMKEWQKFMGDDIPYESTCPNLPPGDDAPTTL